MKSLVRTHSVRARILMVFLGEILLILAAVLGVFNILVSRYVSSAATAQLTAVVSARPDRSVSGQESSVIPDVSVTRPSVLNTRPGAFSISSDYVATTLTSATKAEQKTAGDLASWLKSKDLTLATVKNLRATVDDGSTYYLSCVATGTGSGYLVFYVDVTGVINFAASVNRILLVLMLVAVGFAILATVLITRSVTRPLTVLTDFAHRLGSGDFRANPHKFHDREFATLADSMNRAASQLETYDKDQKTFFQNASHELRTPLTSIACYAEGIACGVMEPVAASRTILEETSRLTGMVEDLLAISRIDALGSERKAVTCDLPGLLNTAAEEQRSVASGRGVSIVPAEATPGMVISGDDVALRQAFVNLVSNAIRYARSRVVLACEAVGEDAVVTVSDDGAGIGPDDLPHVFERFYKGPGGSHGIGLAIVRSVAEHHGGRVEVDSAGTGSTFRLVFPGALRGERRDARHVRHVPGPDRRLAGRH